MRRSRCWSARSSRASLVRHVATAQQIRGQGRRDGGAGQRAHRRPVPRDRRHSRAARGDDRVSRADGLDVHRAIARSRRRSHERGHDRGRAVRGLSRGGVGHRRRSRSSSPTSIVRLNGVDAPRSARRTLGVRPSRCCPPTARSALPSRCATLLEIQPFPWWIVALIAAVIVDRACCSGGGCAVAGRPSSVLVVDPYVRAQSEFQRIEALGLLEAGERGRYVTLMIEVLRDYLAARYAEAGAVADEHRAATVGARDAARPAGPARCAC